MGRLNTDRADRADLEALRAAFAPRPLGRLHPVVGRRLTASGTSRSLSHLW
jgi:hypothetical protein